MLICSLNPSVRNIILEDVKRGYERRVASNGQQSRILHSKQPENDKDSGIDFQPFSRHEGLSETCQGQGRNCRGLGCMRCLFLPTQHGRGGTGYYDMEITNRLVRNRIIEVVEEDGMKNSFPPPHYRLLWLKKDLDRKRTDLIHGCTYRR